MQIGTVVGHATSTVKHPTLNGWRLLVVQMLTPDGKPDGEPVLAGQVVRVVTTGGGGWGDPLEREPELVQRDVIEGKVSAKAARDDYGVALKGAEFDVDPDETARLRGDLRAARAPAKMIDRGPGFDVMLRGEAKPRMRSV